MTLIDETVSGCKIALENKIWERSFVPAVSVTVTSFLALFVCYQQPMFFVIMVILGINFDIMKQKNDFVNG